MMIDADGKSEDDLEHGPIADNDNEISEVLPDEDPTLSESFQLALDMLKRSTNIEQKIKVVIPETLHKLDTDDRKERAEATAILMTLADSDHECVRLTLAEHLGEWAALSPEDAGRGALKMVEMDSRPVNIAMAESLKDWIDANPEAAEQVAMALAEHKGIGVNLALAENLPDWADQHAKITGSVAKKLAKDYNHLNAVTNLLEKTYGKNWRDNIDEVTGKKPEGKEGATSLIAELFLKAGEHVERIKVALAQGVSEWAGFNPDDAEDVVSILTEEVKTGQNKALAREVNDTLLNSLNYLAEEHPKTTARLAAIIVTNPDPAVVDSVIDVFNENPKVDPNPAYDAVKDLDDHPRQETLERLALCHDHRGQENLLEDLGL